MLEPAAAAAPTPPAAPRPSLPAIALGLAFPSLLTWAYFVALAGAPRPLQQGVYGAGKAVQFALPLAWWWLAARRLPRPARPCGRGVLAGLLSGLAILAAALALYHLVLAPAGVFAGGPGAAIRAKVEGLGVASPARFAALGAFYALLHSGAEEYYWRWWVFGLLRRRAPVVAAVALSSAGFMAHHVLLLSVFFGWGSPLTYAFALAVAVGGAFWAWLYHRTGSLLGPWVSHLLVDAALFLVGWTIVR